MHRACTASHKHQAPSRGGEGIVCLIERVLEARARKLAHHPSVLRGTSLKEKEREKERERRKERHGDLGADGAKVF